MDDYVSVHYVYTNDVVLLGRVVGLRHNGNIERAQRKKNNGTLARMDKIRTRCLRQWILRKPIPARAAFGPESRVRIPRYCI